MRLGSINPAQSKKTQMKLNPVIKEETILYNLKNSKNHHKIY